MHVGALNESFKKSLDLLRKYEVNTVRCADRDFQNRQGSGAKYKQMQFNIENVEMRVIER